MLAFNTFVKCQHDNLWWSLVEPVSSLTDRCRNIIFKQSFGVWTIDEIKLVSVTALKVIGL